MSIIEENQLLDYSSTSSAEEFRHRDMPDVVPLTAWDTDSQLNVIREKLQEELPSSCSQSEATSAHFEKLQLLNRLFSVPLTDAERTTLSPAEAMALSTERKDAIYPVLVKYKKEAALLAEVASVQDIMVKRSKGDHNDRSKDNLYLKLATFKNYPDVKKLRSDIFWRDLSRHAWNNGITESKERLAHFYRAIQGDNGLMRWHETHVQPKIGTLTVEELKDLFFTQTMSPYWQSERLIDLCEISYRPKELVREYNTRFSEAVGDCSRNVYSEAKEDQWLRELYLGKLPTAIRAKLPFKKAEDYINLHALCESAATMHPEAPQGFTIQAPKCRQDCSHRLLCPVREHNGKDNIFMGKGIKRPAESNTKVDSGSTHKKKKIDLKNKDIRPAGDDNWKWCNHHESWGRHDSKDCFKSNGKKTEDTRPYNRHLKAAGQSEYEQQLIDLDEFFDDNCYDNWVRTTFNEQPSNKSLELRQSLSSPVELPIELEGNRLIALADTGANHNFIATYYAKELGLKITTPKELELKIVLASNQTVPQVGTCLQVKVTMAPLFLNTPARVFRIDLIVMDMEQTRHPLLFGLPALQLFGIGLQGIPKEFPTIVENTPSAPVAEISVEVPEIKTNLEHCLQVLSSDKDNKLYSSYLRFYREYILSNIKDLLDSNTSIIGFCSLPNSQITFDTGNNYPSYRRQYRIPHHLESIVTAQVHTWLEDGVIVPSKLNSPWNSAVLVAPKKDISGNTTGWRVCIDPRHINLLLPAANFPLPLIREVLEQLGNAVVYSKIDLRQGFHQLLVKKEDRIKTTFTWKNKQYHFVGAPFGFKNVPSSFQMVMTGLFNDLNFVKVYVDDIVIFSNDFKSHLSHIKRVLELLNGANLRIKPAKCTFCVQKLQLLGYEVTPNGYQVCLEKLVNLEGSSYPKTGNQMEKHLGFFNFFRDVIPLYSKLTAPLDKLRKVPNLENVWTQEHSKAYDNLKKALLASQILSYPDFSRSFKIVTDASDKGLGAILYQENASGMIRYIAFAARSLSESERGYGATKRELAAIIFALEKFRYYVWGTHFTVYTDHNALKYIFTQKHSNQMINNWLEQLLDYDFNVVHLPGVQNILPDKLSRIYDADSLPRQANASTLKAVNLVDNGLPIESFDPGHLHEVPLESRKILIERAHSAGHFGSTSIIKSLITQGKSWPSMRQEVNQEVSKCLPCQRYNIGKHGFHPLKSITAELPFDHIAIDLKSLPTSTQGYNYILVVVDICTRYVFLRAIKDKEAATVAGQLLKIFIDIGFPKVIQSDNGTEFVNAIMSKICEISGIDHRLISSYHARANGVAERFVQTTAQTILKILDGNLTQWEDQVPAVQYYINSKVSSRTNSTPYSLMFGRPLNNLVDYRKTQIELLTEEGLLKRITYLNDLVYPTISAAVKAKKAHDIEKWNKANSHKIIEEGKFIPGAIVMALDECRPDKTSPRYLGPMTVLRRTKGGSYILKGQDGTEYRRPPSTLKMVTREPAEPLEDNHCVVEKILEHRGTGHSTEYLVKWKNVHHSQNEWLTKDDFDGTTMIMNYHKLLRQTHKRKGKKGHAQRKSKHNRNPDLQTTLINTTTTIN
jgi:transposase InsO family protein